MKTYRVWKMVGVLFVMVGLVGCSRLFTNVYRIGWDFDEETGAVPQELMAAETNGKGTPGTWEVSGGAVVLSETTNSGQTYNLLLTDGGSSIADIELWVKVQARAGVEDQGGGVIWRAVDADNYYICRWNPLEDNFRVYYVKEGKRTQIASADVVVDPLAWHTIHIRHEGKKITAALDDETVIEVGDVTFSEAGQVGLWTKADAVTAFDDFMMRPIK